MRTSSEIQDMLDGDINKAIAAHRGKITVLHRDGDAVHVEMIGGCQGCAGARFTLNSIVSAAIKEFDSSVVNVVDDTDHVAGTTPFYKKGDSSGS